MKWSIWCNCVLKREFWNGEKVQNKMRTYFKFQSDKFPPYKGEEKEINPNRWGKRLAEFLHQSLAKKGIEVENIIPEDWGWIVPIKNDEFPLWIGCGNYGDHSNEYLCFIEPSKPAIRKWFFKKIDTSVKVARIINSLNNIFAAELSITNITWGTADDFDIS